MYGKSAIGGSNDWNFNCTFPNLKLFNYIPLSTPTPTSTPSHVSASVPVPGSVSVSVSESHKHKTDRIDGTDKEVEGDLPIEMDQIDQETPMRPMAPHPTSLATQWTSYCNKSPIIKEILNNWCNGSVILNTSANTENSYNRNGLNYTLKGMTVGWNSSDMRHKWSMEWFKRDCNPPTIPEAAAGIDPVYNYGHFHWVPYVSTGIWILSLLCVYVG